MSPNLLLERAIKVDRPRQVIVGDITTPAATERGVGVFGNLDGSVFP